MNEVDSQCQSRSSTINGTEIERKVESNWSRSDHATMKSAKSRKDESTEHNSQPQVINHQQLHPDMLQQVFGDFPSAETEDTENIK